MGVTLAIEDAGTWATVVTEAGGEPVTLSLHDASQSVTAQVTESLSGPTGPTGPQGPPGADGADGYTPPKSPLLTYSGGQLSRIDYAAENGQPVYKIFSWASGRLNTITFHRGAATTTKIFSWNPDGSLNSITETAA